MHFASCINFPGLLSVTSVISPAGEKLEEAEQERVRGEERKGESLSTFRRSV